MSRSRVVIALVGKERKRQRRRLATDDGVHLLSGHYGEGGSRETFWRHANALRSTHRQQSWFEQGPPLWLAPSPPSSPTTLPQIQISDKARVERERATDCAVEISFEELCYFTESTRCHCLKSLGLVVFGGSRSGRGWVIHQLPPTLFQVIEAYV
jgi:hypothetical protein